MAARTLKRSWTNWRLSARIGLADDVGHRLVLSHDQIAVLAAHDVLDLGALVPRPHQELARITAHALVRGQLDLEDVLAIDVPALAEEARDTGAGAGEPSVDIGPKGFVERAKTCL